MPMHTIICVVDPCVAINCWSVDTRVCMHLPDLSSWPDLSPLSPPLSSSPPAHVETSTIILYTNDARQTNLRAHTRFREYYMSPRQHIACVQVGTCATKVVDTRVCIHLPTRFVVLAGLVVIAIALCTHRNKHSTKHTSRTHSHQIYHHRYALKQYVIALTHCK